MRVRKNGDYGFVLCYKTHIVGGDIPLLLSIADMDKLKLYFRNISNELHHQPSGTSVTLSKVSSIRLQPSRYRVILEVEYYARKSVKY